MQPMSPRRLSCLLRGAPIPGVTVQQQCCGGKVKDVEAYWCTPRGVTVTMRQCLGCREREEQRNGEA